MARRAFFFHAVVLFSTDSPHEDRVASARWFDTGPLSEHDRLKMGREKAVKLFGL